MMDRSFLDYRPKLKPYRIQPAEENPTEFLLILEEDGAALGISLTERRLIEWIDGQRSIADIVERLVKEEISTLTGLRRLVWDLQRYGFLESSPWEEKGRVNAWGYWGIQNQRVKWFCYSSILGPLESVLAHVLVSPYYLALAFAGWAAGFWFSWDYLHEVPVMMIHDSVALAVLVMLLSVPGALVLSSWFMSVALHAVDSSPVHLLVHFRHGIPNLWVDGRRLRRLPLWRSVPIALSPVLSLALLASGGWALSCLSAGIRGEWLFHVSLSIMLTCMILLIPWNPTVLSREVVYRLRGDSIFWTTNRAIQKAFRSFFAHKVEGVPHEHLFLSWGIWAILSILLLIKLVTTLFRWDFPILVNHFLQENNVLVLVLLFLVGGLICLSLLGALLTFLGWLLKELFREIHHRFYPRHDRAIAAILSLSLLMILVLMQQSGLGGERGNGIQAVAGLLLVWAGIYFYRREGKGFEPTVNLFVALVGAVLLAHVLAVELNRPLLVALSQLAMMLALLGYCLGYNEWLYRGKFSFTTWGFRPPGMALLLITLFALFRYDLHLALQEELNPLLSVHLMALGGLIFLVIFSLVGTTNWYPEYRSASQRYINFSFVLLWFSLLWKPEWLRFPMAGFLAAVGMAGVVAGMVLRHAALAKTALGLTAVEMGHAEIRTRQQWNFSNLVEALRLACQELYRAVTRRGYASASYEESVRQFLLQLYSLCGAAAMRALVFRAARDLHLEATKQLVSLLPVPVSLPRLTDWTTEKIIAYLRNVPTFMYAGDEVEKIASLTRFELYEPGDTLIEQDEQEDDLFVIVQGKILVEMGHTFGHTRLAVLSAGDFVGEIAFLSGRPRTACVRALEPVLVLAVSRNDIDETMPLTQKCIFEAELGQSWLQVLSALRIFSEFPPSLITRVSLESRHINLEIGRTLPLHHPEYEHSIAVMLSGRGVFLQDGRSLPIREGVIVGLEETVKNLPLQGVIRAESASHLVLVNRELFLETLIELLTPKQILRRLEQRIEA